MKIINTTKNIDKIYKLYFKYFYFKFFLKIHIISAVLAIAIFTYIFINIPMEFYDVKLKFLFMVVPSLAFGIIILPFILKHGIKKRLFSNESIFDYKFNNNFLEFNKIENGINYFCKIDYSLVLVVIETKELFILNTDYNSYPILIIDKNEFITGTSASLRKLLKTKIKKYKQAFKCDLYGNI